MGKRTRIVYWIIWIILATIFVSYIHDLSRGKRLLLAAFCVVAVLGSGWLAIHVANKENK